MQPMRIGVLVAGVALAGAAVYMVQQFVGQAQAQLERDKQTLQEIGPLAKVFVVTKPLNYGDALTPEDIKMIYWPKNALPETIFTAEEPPFEEGEKQPRYVLRQFEAFEPLLSVKVTAPGETAGLTSMLKPGQRAFSIQFRDAAGATRALQAGNHVDIYWTGVDVNGSNKTMLIESSIQVIAVDREARKGGGDNSMDPPKALTVAASQEQVARLTQAQSSGNLSVVLVAKQDENAVAAAAIEVGTEIFGQKAAEPVIEAPVVEKVCTVRQRVGTEVVEVPIPCTN